MNITPIVFCFDDNFQMPAGICITSLLENTNPDTFYDIFILHNNLCEFPYNGYLDRLIERYKNCNITYRSVGNAFENAFEIRGINISTYYRLLIPELIQEYDKIMYHDVDVIFRDDLFEIFSNTEMDDFYVAGVATPYSDISDYIEQKIKVDPTKYIAAGNLIINSRKIREDNIVDQFRKVSEKNWKYQDMDVLNLVCKNKIKYLQPSFCVVGTTTEILSDINQPYYTKEDAAYALHYGIVHYNGAKPWKSWCYNFDIWWEYYRKSIYFDPKFYFDFYNNKLNEYDQLTLWKRVKILLRYFKTGKL